MSLPVVTTTVELADGRELSVQVRNPDHVRFELTANRHGWPTVKVDGDDVTMLAPQLMTTFLAWAALTRTGQYSGKWEDFQNTDCLAIASEESVPDPTPPAPATDSPTS